MPESADTFDYIVTGAGSAGAMAETGPDALETPLE